MVLQVSGTGPVLIIYGKQTIVGSTIVDYCRVLSQQTIVGSTIHITYCTREFNPNQPGGGRIPPPCQFSSILTHFK